MKRFFRHFLFWALGLTLNTAIGQNIDRAEYFLDQDPGIGNGVSISINPDTIVDQNFALNTDGLTIGLHRIFVRTHQDNGLWGLAKPSFFYVADTVSKEIIRFSTDIIAAEYFYDDDPGPGKGTAIPVQKSSSIDQNWVAPTDELDTGNHVLYIRTKSVDGFWGRPDTAHVSINNTICQVPQVDFSFDTVDINTSIALTDLSTNVDPAATYEWDILADGLVESSNLSFDTSFATRGLYPLKLTITNPDGCSGSAIKNVYITSGFNKSITLSANDSLIVGNTVDLTAPAGYDYEWNTGDTTQIITIDSEGTYFVFLTADSITYQSEQIKVSFFEALTADFNSYNATSGLNNGAAILENINSDGLPYTINWSTGASNVLYQTGLPPGSYSVTITTPLEVYNYPFTIIDTTPTNETIVAAEYFIGSDPGPGNGTPIAVYQAETLNINFELDVTGLAIGSYKLYTRVKNASGYWSVPKYRYFHVFDPAAKIYEPFDYNIVNAEYYFDNDPGPGNGIPIALNSGKSVDVNFAHLVNDLSGGLHFLYVRAQNDAGTWSGSSTISFFVIGMRYDNILTFKTDIVDAEYFIDSDPGVGNGVRLPVQKDSNVNNRPWAAKTDGLLPGDHTLNIRVKSQDGTWNTISSQIFTINEDPCTPPVADFSFDTVGVETLIGITDLSTNLADSTSYAWDILGDGVIESTSPNFDTTFAANGVYPLKLTVYNHTDGCFASVVKDIYITDGLPTEITADKGDSLLVGDSISFSAPAGFAYEWNTGDTTQTLTVGVSGTYYVWLSADGITYKSKSLAVYYFNPISANLSVHDATTGLDNGAARLTNINTDGLPYEIIWSNGINNETSQTGLAQGAYNVEIRTVLDTLSFAFSIGQSAPVGTEIVQAEYYLNADPGPGNGVPISIYQADTVDFDFIVNTDTMEVGIYKLYLRTKQADGFWGVPKTRYFYVLDPNARVYEEIDRKLTKAEYFIDSDPGIGKGTPIAFDSAQSVDQNFALNTSNITPGLHFLYLRTHQSDGLWGPPNKTGFFVLDSAKNDVLIFRKDMVAAEYFFDEDPGIGKGTPIPIQKTDLFTNRPWSAATDSLEQGKHKLYLRVKTQDGLWNVVRQTEVFLYPSSCDLPKADFTFDSVGINTTIGLTDLSTNVLGGATYKWDIYGDGIIESTSPTYDTSFTEEGVYPIRLTVTNTEGCFTSIVRDVLVVGNIPGELLLSGSDSLLVGDTLTITAAAGYSYEWNTGDTTQELSVTRSGEFYAYLTDGEVNFRTKVVNTHFFKPITASLTTYDATGGLSNGAARLDSINADGLPVSIIWSHGPQDVTEVANLPAGNYSVDLITPLETKTFNYTIQDAATTANSLVALEYFIDADPGPGQGNIINTYHSPAVSVLSPITFTGISEGSHQLYVRAKNENGLWGPAVKKYFYILKSNPLANLTYGGNIIYAEYAFDSLPGLGQGVPIAITPAMSLDESLAVDISGLANGSHQLYLQVKDESGNWSMRQPEAFTICSTLPSVPVVNSVSGCKGDNFTLAASNVTETVNWYDVDGNLLQSSTSTTYQLSNVSSSTSVFVAQSNGEGCESALVEASVTVSDVEIFAGPDIETYPTIDSIQLFNNSYPAGGTWSGSTFVSADGIFRPSNSGIGTFNLTYSLDSAGCTVTDEMQIVVKALNNATPLISPQSFTIAENSPIGTSVGTITATDSNPLDVLTFAIISGNSSGTFQLNSATGKLTIADNAILDFETFPTINLTVQVFDGYSTAEGTITVSLTDVNEPPTISNQSFTIEEHSPNGTIVGIVQANDPEGNLTFSITSNAFSINGTTGELTVLDYLLLDFETTPQITLTVNISDGTFADAAIITINLTDVQEMITFNDQSFSIPENVSSGTLIGTLVASDVNNLPLTFNIADTSLVNDFSISGNNLFAMDTSILDHELNPSITVAIQADNGTVIDTASITINITDVNEAPAYTNLRVYRVDQGGSNGSQIGVVGVTDPEGDPLTFSILSGNVNNAFAIGLNSGALTINNTTAIDYDIQSDYTLSISVTDGSFTTDTDISIRVTTLARDKQALLELFNATDGPNWTQNTNWSELNPISSDWFGVTVSADRVTGLSLPSNNLTGEVPESFGDLTGLTTINLEDNSLTGFPDISFFPNLTALDISANKLLFKHIVPNRNVTGVNYSNQKRFGTTKYDTLEAGSNYSLGADLPLFDSNTELQWNFGPLIPGKLYNNDVSPISGAISSLYNIQNIDITSQGTYRLITTHPDIPGMIIESRNRNILAQSDFFGAVTLNGQPVTSADVVVWRKTPSGPFVREDSAVVNSSGQYLLENVVLGSFIVLARPDQSIAAYQYAVQTYYINAVTYSEADELLLDGITDGININLLDYSPDPVGTAIVYGTVESEFDETTLDEEDPNARINARRKVRKAACSMRRFKSQGRPTQDFQDSVEAEIAYYIETDDDGYFNFEGVEEGKYLLNIEFPGVPMDSTSEVVFNIGGDKENQVINVSVLIGENSIQVYQDEILFNWKPYLKDVVVYPNPSDGKISVDYTVYRHLNSLFMQLISNEGKVIYEQPINHQKGSWNIELDMTSQSVGVYHMVFSDESGNRIQQSKVIRK
ncbi:cadherin domain-containing protein [Marinoscillum sp. MHG1-6]|uniref:cadherin domain-containing protein n=1 Tax=Marinoscillum sp. MHG1-6 TaxID=2959627 RepID=UPI0021579BD8|nr:cadherin domain-containing protein [Marinoscillum sp. MHG1-6]